MTSQSTPAAAAGHWRVVTTLGVAQILAWGSSYYLPAVLATPIAADTGWPLAWVVGGLSLGLLASGLVSPRVGRAIERHGGRPVLAASAALLATGLLGIGLAANIWTYLAAWAVLGVGMGSGLYDAAFATLGLLCGRDARRAITGLTLFGGFASTVCWPLSAYLVEAAGWRGACFAYASLLVVLVLPLYLLLPRAPATPPGRAPDRRPVAGSVAVAPGGRNAIFLLLAATFTLGSVIASVVSVHLLTILQARDIGLAAAVALGALVGPSQVGARAVEMMFGGRYHPIWTLAASTVLIAAGLVVLLSGLPVVALALVFYGAGVGISSIARGTLPLALFGADGYAALMGRLAMPMLLAQALSPALGAIMIERLGATGTLAILSVCAIMNIALATLLWAQARTSSVLAQGST